MKPQYPFTMRLEAAQRMLARRAASTSEHLVDQLDAASGETESMAQRLGMLLPILSPERSWFQRENIRPSELRLPMRRIDCQRCVQTLRRPPADEADQCDICQQPEVLTFVPFAVRHGPVLIAGEVCRDCAGVLGIRQEDAA